MKITQFELDKLADIIWWIKGYLAADEYNCPFTPSHVDALILAHDKLARLIHEQKRENKMI